MPEVVTMTLPEAEGEAEATAEATDETTEAMTELTLAEL